MGNEKPVQPPLPIPNDNGMIALGKAKKQSAVAPKKIKIAVNDKKSNSTSTEKNVASSTKKEEKEKTPIFHT